MQSSTKDVLSQALFVVATILFIGAYAGTAQAAPLFEEPVNYEISKFDDLGEEDWGGQVLDSVIADFNNDGHPDIAGTYQDVGTPSADYDTPAGIEGVVILINSGDGTFTITDYIPYSENLITIVSEDFDGDGDVDLATTNTDDLTILLNDGSGNFAIASQLETGADRLTSADFDNDGDVDFAVTVVEISPENGIQNEPGIQVFMNDGMGGFTLDSSIPTYTPGYTGIADLTVADFDGDGDVDIFAGSGNGIAIYSVILNDGNGTFETSEVTLYTEEGENAPQFDELTSVDVDNDNDVDVVATMDGSQLIRLITLVNDGTGSFAVGQTFNSGGPGPVVTSDFDDNGYIDLLIISENDNGQVYLWVNNPTGVFTSGENLLPNFYPEGGMSLNVADLNNDNEKDLVVSSTQYGIWVVLQTASDDPTPVEQATALVNDVIVLDLSNNLENSYLANLFKVEGFIQNGQITPAINQLNAFIGKVNQDYNQNKITQQVRDDLVASAQQLIDDLTS